jgi:hypothetical protein
MTTLPTPPAIIKIKEDFSRGLDLNKPLHAAAYLKAASHFLSSWPQDWDAQRLRLAIIADEDEEDNHWEDHQKVNFWHGISENAVHPMDNPFTFLEDIITNLAEDFLIFLTDNA